MKLVLTRCLRIPMFGGHPVEPRPRESDAIIEVNSACNMACPLCFSDAPGRTDQFRSRHRADDPAMSNFSNDTIIGIGNEEVASFIECDTRTFSRAIVFCVAARSGFCAWSAERSWSKVVSRGVSAREAASMSGDDCGRFRSCLSRVWTFPASRWCIETSRRSFVSWTCACNTSC